MKGSGIHGTVREFLNENIDVINFSANNQLFIQRALNPAKVSSIKLHEDTKRADVYLKPDEVSMAIGKGGLNIRLASQLTGYEIDVYREVLVDDEVFNWKEFAMEIESGGIDQCKSIGWDTAKNVLSLTRSELIKGTDLEEETIDEVLRILKTEFE